jgi:MFS family permease
MSATSLALIAAAFSGKERGTAFGIYGAVIGGSVAVGPLIGGALTSGLSWRWIFYINVPIGVLAVIVTLLRLHESKAPNARWIDWIGLPSFSGALVMQVVALVRGPDDG